MQEIALSPAVADLSALILPHFSALTLIYFLDHVEMHLLACTNSSLYVRDHVRDLCPVSDI